MEPISLFRAKPEVEPKQRLQFDNSLRRWFNRNLGLWRSRRQYFFDDDQAMRVDMFLRMEAFSEPVEGEAAYRFTWWPQKEYDFFDKNPRYVREGTLRLISAAISCAAARLPLRLATKSQIRQVDEHELVFESHYLEWDILEHIRLVDMDRYRARSIYSWCNGELVLAEVHHEERLESSGQPLTS